MRTACAVAVVLLASSALGGTITSLNPSSIKVASGEYFMQINGSGLSGTVAFDGGAGHFELDANATAAGHVIVWVPLEIVNDPGTYTVTVGDSNSASFTVVKPGKPPLRLHLPEILLKLAKSRLWTSIDYEVTTTGGDESSTIIQCEPKSGSDFPFGQSRITCVARDDSGGRDEGTIDVNVWDGTAPEIKLPKSFEVPSEKDEGAYVKFEASAFDEVDGELRVTCLPESGSFFRNGRTSVGCEAIDQSLNPVYGSFDVFVQPRDIGKLQLRVPDKVVEAATSEWGAEVSFEVIAYGSADPDPVVECTPASGSYFRMGTTKVYCTAWDDFDQRAEGGFTVEVVEKLPLRMPDVTAEAMSPSGTEVTWEPLAEEWSSTITCTPGPGSLFAFGVTTVECESTDDHGRRAGGTFKVNVADTIAPHISRVHANAGAVDGDVVPVSVAVEAIDAADAMPRCSIATLTADGGGAFDWRIKSELEVEVRADTNRAFRIQVSCIDASGNRSTGSVAVSLPGTIRRRPIAN